MSKSKYVCIAYYSDGETIDYQWRTRGFDKTGPATDAGLKEWVESMVSRRLSLERAVIIERKNPRNVKATYLRDPMPTETQNRVMERILSKPGVKGATIEPQANGDLRLTIWGNYPDTTIFRHPTIEELIYGTD
jgi:hypothetical protein